MKNKNSIQKISGRKFVRQLAGLLIFIFIYQFSNAQNSNTVSKKGPMAIEANTYTGNIYIGRFDLALPNRELPLVVGFSYNSVLYQTNTGFGKGWSFSYDIHYRMQNDSVIIFWADGREDIFTPAGNGEFKGEMAIMII